MRGKETGQKGAGRSQQAVEDVGLWDAQIHELEDLVVEVREEFGGAGVVGAKIHLQKVGVAFLVQDEVDPVESAAELSMGGVQHSRGADALEQGSQHVVHLGVHVCPLEVRVLFLKEGNKFWR